MMKKVFLIYLVLGVSCSQIINKNAEHSNSLNKQGIESEKNVIFQVHSYDIRPGEVVNMSIPFSQEANGKLLCKDKEVSYFYDGKKVKAFLAETYFSNYKNYSCFLNNIEVAKVKVLKKDFPSERLRVNKRRVTLNKKDLKRVLKERAFLKTAYSDTSSYPLFSKPFILPVESKITSIYGSKRVFNNKKQSQHLGTDYRAAIGAPIVSSNKGKVIVARHLFYTGNTVVIDHGMNIFTIYGHLSKLNVQEGEIVPRELVIGLAGATGRVTGPHLHWGVKVNELAIEGSSLVRESVGFTSSLSEKKDNVELAIGN